MYGDGRSPRAGKPDDARVAEPLILAGDVARLERRFASASRTYGYEIRPPERLIAEMGEVQLELFRRPEEES